MFAVFAHYACTANIYTYEFNIACMLQKGCYYAKIKSAKTFLTFAKVYTLKIIIPSYTVSRVDKNKSTFLDGIIL